MYLVSGLARALSTNRKGVSVYILICGLCQKSLSYRKELENVQSAVVWCCGHCFHTSCFRAAEVANMCPQCRTKGTPAAAIKKSTESSSLSPKAGVRPDLEGHF